MAPPGMTPVEAAAWQAVMDAEPRRRAPLLHLPARARHGGLWQEVSAAAIGIRIARAVGSWGEGIGMWPQTAGS